MATIRLLPLLPKLLLSIALLAFAGGGRARAQITFQKVVVDSNGPDQIWGKSVGDLDHDGLPDLIAGGHEGGGLVWYQNPSWTKRTIAASGNFSTDHEVCDVDRDGDNDIVSLQSPVYWYEAPSWTEHFIVGNPLHDIEVFDFDGDGDCDLAGRGQGSFSAGGGASLYLYTQQSPSSWSETEIPIPDGEGLASADIDGDQDIDIIVNEVWLENPGPDLGAWTQHLYTTSWNHRNAYVAIADVNGDTHQDIILAPSEREGNTYRISWFEGPADPTQAGWTEHVVDSSVNTVHHFAGAGDFDLDGDIDIATAEMDTASSTDEVKIYRNDGDTFSKVVISNDGSHSMRVLDVDLDGDLDLYGANWDGSQVDLFINQTPRKPLALDAWQRHVIDPSCPGTAVFIAADDLDGDDRLDIAAGGYWYRNPGTPSGAWTRSAFGSPLNNLAVLHDFDSDGDIDVLGTQGINSEADPNFVFGQNDGLGSFTLLQNVPSGSGDFLQGVTVARLSPGERKRVVLSWHAGPSLVEALVVPDDPASGLWSLQTLALTTEREAVSHGDIDRDGDQDVLLGTLWLENEGILPLDARTVFQTSEWADRNRLADMDRDGRLDAVVGYEAASRLGAVAWYRQPSDSTNAWSETVIAQVIGPMSLDVADMDRDGDLDVVVGEHNLSDPASAGLFVFENLDGKGGAWTRHTVHIGDEHHDGAQVVDIDRDGDFDIISIGWSHDRVLLYENRAATGGSGGSDPSPDADLLAAWGFAGSAPPVADTSGNGNTGYLKDGATRSEDGYHGKALETDGVTGHVDLGPFDVGSEELTLMAWINADDFDTADARILSKSSGSATSDHVWMLSTIGGPHVRFRLKTDDGSTTTLVGTGSTLSAGAWHHIAATYDGIRMRIYQNGNEVASVPKNGSVFQAPSVQAYIAANPGASDQVFDGRIDDVKVFGRALTRDEIAVEMTRSASVPAPTSSPREPTWCETLSNGKVWCSYSSCSMGPMRRSAGNALMWLVVALAALAIRATRHRQ